MADYSMANREIACTLGRGRAYISDMSSTNGYMGAKKNQEFGPSLFDMSSAGGHMGVQRKFRNLVSDSLACHVPNVARHGVSISSVSCQNSACQRVRAMSWPPWLCISSAP